MIWLDDDPDSPQNLVVPDGLSVPEAVELDCEFWTPEPDGERKAVGCCGFGHYLCGECASLDRTDPLVRDWLGLPELP